MGDQSVGGEQRVSCLSYVALDSRRAVSWGWRMVVAEWKRWSCCRQRLPVGLPRVCRLVVAPAAGGAAFVLKRRCGCGGRIRRCARGAGSVTAAAAAGSRSGQAPPVGRRRSAGAPGPIGSGGSPHWLFCVFLASPTAVLSPTVRCRALPCVAVRWDARPRRLGAGGRCRRLGARGCGVTVSPTRCRDCVGARPLRENGGGAWQVTPRRTSWS